MEAFRKRTRDKGGGDGGEALDRNVFVSNVKNVNEVDD